RRQACCQASNPLRTMARIPPFSEHDLRKLVPQRITGFEGSFERRAQKLLLGTKSAASGGGTRPLARGDSPRLLELSESIAIALRMLDNLLCRRRQVFIALASRAA